MVWKYRSKYKSKNSVCFKQFLVILCMIFLTAYENPSLQTEKTKTARFYETSRSVQSSYSENSEITRIQSSTAYVTNDYFKYIYKGLTLIYFRNENGTILYEPIYFPIVNYTTGGFSVEPSNRKFYFKKNNELDALLLALWREGDDAFYDFYGSAKFENRREAYCIKISHPNHADNSSYLIYDYSTGILVEEYIESENLLVKLHLWSNWPLIISADISVIILLIFLIGIPLIIGNIEQIKSKVTPKISFFIIKICSAFSVFTLIFLGLTWKATSTLPVIIEISILSAGIYFLSTTSSKQTSNSDFKAIFSNRQNKWLELFTFVIMDASLLFVALEYALGDKKIDQYFGMIKPSGMIVGLFFIILFIISQMIPKKEINSEFYD